MTEHRCVVCAVLDPAVEPRIYERANVCEPCRRRMAEDLARLPERYALLPGALELGSSNGPKVSGTPSRSLGVRLDPLNLLSPAGEVGSVTERDVVPVVRTVGPPLKPRGEVCGETAVIPTTVKDGNMVVIVDIKYTCGEEFGHVHQHREGRTRWPFRQKQWRRVLVLDEHGKPKLTPPHDQHGPLPTLVVLDQWVTDWIDVLGLSEHPPPATMTGLTLWLRDRLQVACDEHPAIDEFARELSGQARTVASAASTDHGRGEGVGRCPAVNRDDTRCGARLRVDPYVDQIQCGRCGTRWDRRKGEWLKLRAAQREMEAA